MEKYINLDFNCLGDFIKDIRLENNLSQNNLAILMGVAQNSISRYERGSRNISFDFLNKFLKYFKLTIVVVNK